MRLIPWVRNLETPSRANLPFGASRIFDQFFSDWPFHPMVCEGTETWRPVVDVVEKDGNLILRAELPGVDQKDIELKLEGNVLTLKGERKLEHEENRDNYRRIESSYGAFARSFTLPESVERDKIRADYKNGVLTVTIPQKPESKPREIAVKVN